MNPNKIKIFELNEMKFEIPVNKVRMDNIDPDNASCESNKKARYGLRDIQIFRDHLELTDRLKKTLYCGRLSGTDCSSLPLTSATIEMFSKAVPKGGLGVLDMHYAASVSRKACISPYSMILAMVYLEQLRHKNPEYLQKVSSCDLFLVSMMVASKYLYDDGEEEEVFNDDWASWANIDIKDLNRIEREFLAAMDWEVFVKPTDFFSLLHQVEIRIAHSETSRRGWLTYTDVWVLAQGPTFIHYWYLFKDSVVQVVIVSAVAYVAATLIIVGAVAVAHLSCTPVREVLQSLLHTRYVEQVIHSEQQAYFPHVNNFQNIFNQEIVKENFHTLAVETEEINEIIPVLHQENRFIHRTSHCASCQYSNCSKPCSKYDHYNLAPVSCHLDIYSCEKKIMSKYCHIHLHQHPDKNLGRKFFQPFVEWYSNTILDDWLLKAATVQSWSAAVPWHKCMEVALKA